MADLKHTAAQIDAAIYAVERGSVVTENTVKEVTLGEAKPVSADAIAKELQKKVDKVEGKGLSTNDYTTAEKAQVAKNTSDIATNTVKIAEHGKSIAANAESLERKAGKNGRYDKLTSGFAVNIVGDGSATEEVIGFRPTAGEERNVANTTYIDGERNEAARMTRIKGNSVVCEGELIDGHYSALRTTGFNQFNGRYAKVLAGVTYHVTGDITSIGFATEEGGTTEDITLDNGKYTPTQNGYIYATGDNICIHLCWSEYAHMEDMYEAYKPFVRDLSWIKKYFPNGMRSAGNVRDEIRYNAAEERWEAVKRVGVVDLGSLTWLLANNIYYIYSATISDMKGATNVKERLSGLLCSKYPVDTTIGLGEEMTDQTIKKKDNVLHYKNTALTELSLVKPSMQGVMLNYELAAPIVTPIEEDISLDYDCSDYGTEELISEGASAQLVADVVYAPNALSTLKQVPDILKRLAVLEAKAVESTNVTMEE